MQRAETLGFRIFARVSSLVCAIPVIPDGRPAPAPLEESHTRDFLSPCKRKRNWNRLFEIARRPSLGHASLRRGKCKHGFAERATWSENREKARMISCGFTRIHGKGRMYRLVVSGWSEPVDFGLKTQSSLLNLNDLFHRVIIKTNFCEWQFKSCTMSSLFSKLKLLFD